MSDVVKTLAKREHYGNHEYNYFLDRELQEQLLSYEDSVYERGMAAPLMLKTALVSAATEGRPVRTKIILDDISGWTNFENPPKIVKAPEKPATKIRTRDISLRDPRQKDIQVDFYHFLDNEKYMEQYRYDHTYRQTCMSARGNLSSCGGSAVDSCQVGKPVAGPEQLTSRQQRHSIRTKEESSRSKAPMALQHKSQSESSILDLQHKYKFDPDVLKTAAVPTSPGHSPLLENEPGPSAEGEGKEINQSSTGRTRVNSASSNKSSHSIKEANRTKQLDVNQNPTKPPAPPKIMQPLAPNHKGGMLTGKNPHHTPSYAYTLEGQTL